MTQPGEAITAVRPFNLVQKSRAKRPVSLGFVDLKAKGHTRPEPGERYDVISASSTSLMSISFPSTRFRRLDLDLYEFYSADLPDFWRSNEGLLKVNVDTRNPQNLDGTSSTAAFATEFGVKDGDYAPGFLYRGVFRNILFEEWVNLAFDLFELDTDATVYYDKIKSVIDGVPEIKSLDVLMGIPYLNLATKLFDGIIRTFGKNPDDHIWGEIPILEREPTVGGAFLRDGIYVIFEKEWKKGELTVADLAYQDGRLILKDSSKTLTNHLVFGVRILPYQ